jgi:GTP-binding protein
MPRLEISAASEADFPRTGLPEIALVGRSNVGKSTLINALVRQKIARTSAAPGKTRLANFYFVEPAVAARAFYLVDLPGYGYARGGRDSIAAFGTLAEQYFDPEDASLRSLAGVLHLIDARHPDLRQDAAAHEWLLRQQLPIAVLATKMDKLSRRDQSQTLKSLTARYGAYVLPVSAVGGTGLREVWRIIEEWTSR